MKNMTIMKFAIIVMTLSCLLTGCRTPSIHTQASDAHVCATIATQREDSVPPSTKPAPTKPAQTEPSATVPTETEQASTEPAQTEPPTTGDLDAYAPDAYALSILAEVNRARAEHGLQELVLDATICRLAYVRARESAVQWSHTRPNGQPSHSVYPEHGVPWPNCVGENLANYALQDAARIVNAWMGSDGHRKNILYPDYTGAGIAVYFDGEKYYIANLFFG